MFDESVETNPGKHTRTLDCMSVPMYELTFVDIILWQVWFQSKASVHPVKPHQKHVHFE